MDFLTLYIIPSLVILIANVFSGKHGSDRYEFVSALFGWTGIFCLMAYFILTFISVFLYSKTLSAIQLVLSQIWCFSLIIFLSRDYEKFLKPIADKFFKKKK